MKPQWKEMDQKSGVSWFDPESGYYQIVIERPHKARHDYEVSLWKNKDWQIEHLSPDLTMAEVKATAFALWRMS